MNDCTKLYAGGLAETVPQPTLITYSFLRHWFTTNSSLGIALDFLNIPHTKSGEPIITLDQGRTYIDLEKEEAAIYKDSLFSYELQKTAYDEPLLFFDKSKLYSLPNIINTGKTLVAQSLWIASPSAIIKKAADKLNQLPEKAEITDVNKLDQFLTQTAWPSIIAIGLLAEYFAKLLESYKLSSDQKLLIAQYISNSVGQHDWIINSIKDMHSVKTGQQSFSNYMKMYGLRADHDYELSSPRWYEIPWVIQERIEESNEFSTKDVQTPETSNSIKSVIQANIELQILRTTARKRILPYIDLLRRHIIMKYSERYDFNTISRESLLFDNQPEKIKILHNSPHNTPPSKTSGKGLPVSAGIVSGSVLHINSLTQKIPANTVCIFPNASPEFSIKFPSCAGIIFLVGGQTSHGAIVSREYTIPALVDSSAQNIPDSAKITIDGTNGTWQIRPKDQLDS
jgi:phosphohistidine swiveling domain-containing protein